MVTAADLEVDRLLHEMLLDAFPEDGWLSEERADDGARLRRRRVWMVDPIDGTRAFADGLAGVLDQRRAPGGRCPGAWAWSATRRPANGSRRSGDAAPG